jgi:Chalcone isomerase-like
MNRRFAAFAVLLAWMSAAFALEIEGVKLDDRARIGSSDVVLNGAGLRTRLGFKVYAGGLYLVEKTRDANAAVAAPGAKRVAMHMMRDVGAKSLIDAFNDGLEKNTPAAELAKLRSSAAEFNAALEGIGEAKKGDVILIDFVPGAGTVLTVNGQARGKPIAGDDFYRALLRIWLGERPVDGDLRKGMLGQ